MLIRIIRLSPAYAYENFRLKAKNFQKSDVCALNGLNNKRIYFLTIGYWLLVSTVVMVTHLCKVEMNNSVLFLC